jgi:hypothetical protein
MFAIALLAALLLLPAAPGAVALAHPLAQAAATPTAVAAAPAAESPAGRYFLGFILVVVGVAVATLAMRALRTLSRTRRP